MANAKSQMLLPKGATVAVVDGEKLTLFHNAGNEGHPKLKASPGFQVESGNLDSGARHHSSAANPDHGQAEEDSHSAGVATLLNDQVAAGTIKHLVVIASPRALGELRKHDHKQLSATLVGEIAKDLTGYAVHDIEQAINAA
jgi:protein required for attachment to host cells